MKIIQNNAQIIGQKKKEVQKMSKEQRMQHEQAQAQYRKWHLDCRKWLVNLAIDTLKDDEMVEAFVREMWEFIMSIEFPARTHVDGLIEAKLKNMNVLAFKGDDDEFISKVRKSCERLYPLIEKFEVK